ncbi:Transcription antitermination factor NusG [Filimonas lacunae]|uniref:Transcription antitermination factor NusG n=1 Tax=Filimonas lacunae TaxID=477680 RepID=A0A173MFY3_9BACT|nr:UpxY family transcription antiterminator [Filimonas lacunae]BAV06389.1 transcriptional activator RfaH [Filimonas lacunae]SIT26757.1 Transcription antitermination factor NusG [Filimonas lacunae]
MNVIVGSYNPEKMKNEETGKKWFAVYTKPRWEKKINSVLEKKGIESWCPLQKLQRQWSDRKKVIEDPLFKSYVFVRIADQEKLRVLQTDGILNFVYYLNKPAIIKDEEIETIKSYLLQKDAIITVHSIDSFDKDARIKIKQGIFMDQTGTVLRASGKRKVYVSMESLGQVMMVEFPIDHLELID